MIARIAPFAIYILFLAIGSWVPDLGFDRRWLYAVQVGLVTLALMWFWREYRELRDESVVVMHVALAVVLGVVVFVLWINLDARWMLVSELKPGEGFNPTDSGAVNVPLAIVRILGAAVVVPIMEELFWRSFVMRWIDNPNFLAVIATSITLKALLISSVVFGFEHVQWFAGIVAGLAYGWLYKRTGNLWMPILSHAITNGLLGAWVLYSRSWHFW